MLLINQSSVDKSKAIMFPADQTFIGANALNKIKDQFVLYIINEYMMEKKVRIRIISAFRHA